MVIRRFRISPKTKRHILRVILIDHFAVFQKTVPCKDASLHFVFIFSSKLWSIAYGHPVTDYLVSYSIGIIIVPLKGIAVKSAGVVIGSCC